MAIKKTIKVAKTVKPNPAKSNFAGGKLSPYKGKKTGSQLLGKALTKIKH